MALIRAGLFLLNHNGTMLYVREQQPGQRKAWDLRATYDKNAPNFKVIAFG